MFDYLNEVILFSTLLKKGRTLRRAQAIKNSGDVTIFNMLCAEWCSRFKWKSDEKTINSNLIERTILTSGGCAFAKCTISNMKIAGLLTDLNVYRNVELAEYETWRNFKVASSNNLSFYGETTQCTLMDYVGRTYGTFIPVLLEELDSNIANCAIIRDNYYGFPPLLTVFYFAERLSAINASINACIKNVLGTSVISCSRSQAADIVRQREAAEMGVPYVISFDDNDPRPIQASLIATPAAQDALTILFESFNKVHGDFLQAIGVRVNNEMNKKSGTTPMEIIENRQNVDLTLNSAYNCRLTGIELCERIGLNGLDLKLDNFKSLIGSYDANGVLVHESENIDQSSSLNQENGAGQGNETEE